MNLIYRKVYKSVGILLVLFIALQAFALEVIHHDHVQWNNTASRNISSHDCGNKERHVPLDSLHPCIACIQSSINASTPATAFEISPARIFLTTVFIQNGSLLDDEISISGARSPPNSIM